MPGIQSKGTYPNILHDLVLIHRKVKILSRYKFYLAFENLAVDDYVSEKIFEGLFAGTVPVYRGASTISRFMPSNDSFINANDMTPKALSELLLSLMNNQQVMILSL